MFKLSSVGYMSTAVCEGNVKRNLIISCAIIGWCLAGLQASLATTYRWVDEQGNVHYSDKLPPSAMQKEREILDESGRTVKSIGRVETQEEKDAKKQAGSEDAAEKKRLQEERAEQARKDNILLQTFSTERDINLAREDRLTQIDSNISILEANTAKSKKKVETLEAQVAAIEKNKKEVPENVANNLAKAQKKVKDNEAHLARKKKEREVLIEKFDADLKRFRELMAEKEARKAGAVSP